MNGRHCLSIGYACFALAGAAHALEPGDLLFTAYNADEDGWAVVLRVDLAAGTEVFFTDSNFDGSGFGSGEGYLRWLSAPVAAGEVVRFIRTDSATLAAATIGEGQTLRSAGTVERQWVAGSTLPQLAQSGDTLYAYKGTAPTKPVVFLTAITTAGFLSAEGTLQGTGLVVGEQALQLAPGTEFAEYVGARDGFTSVASWQAALTNTDDWTQQRGALFASELPSANAFVPVPESHALWFALVGVALLASRQSWPRIRGGSAVSRTVDGH